eukprot:gene8418-10337_t
MSVFNLVDQAASYGSYHNNKINQLIHIIFVPCIVYTILIFLTYASVPVILNTVLEPISNLSSGILPIGWSTVLTLFFVIYYSILDIRVGFASGLWMLPALYLAYYTVSELGKDRALYFSIGLHIISWVFQFIGHGVYEGRRPALIDNIFQTLIAPFFITLEVLFNLGLLSKEKIAVQKKVNENCIYQY